MTSFARVAGGGGVQQICCEPRPPQETLSKDLFLIKNLNYIWDGWVVIHLLKFYPKILLYNRVVNLVLFQEMYNLIRFL